MRAWPADDPLRTVHTTMSKGLVSHPLLVPVEGREGKVAQSAELAARTMTTRNETGIALPPVIVERRFEYRTRAGSDPLATVTASDTSKGVIFPPLVVELRGGGSTARPAGDPLATVTASGNHHALVMPYYGKGRTAPAGEALSTVTTTARHALVVPAGGTWNEDARPDSEPVRTLSTREAYGLATGPTVDVDDVSFRMLEPSEIKQAMAFPSEYLMLGTRREQVRLSGNAVTPPAARDLVGAVVEAITGEGVAA